MAGWNGTTSLVDHLGGLGEVLLRGAGLLMSPSSGADSPTCVGKVGFEVRYELGQADYPHHESLRVTLVGTDEVANAMLRSGLPPTPLVPLTRYLLKGILAEPLNGVPVRLESVILNPAALSIHRSKEAMDAFFDQQEVLERFLISEEFGGEEDFDLQEWGASHKECMESPGLAAQRDGWAWRVVVGDDSAAVKSSHCQLLIPNLPTRATVASGQLEFDVLPVPGAQARLSDPEAQGLVFPGSCVKIRPSPGGSEEEVVLAATELGWLLGFWAGRAIPPIACEAETSRGPVWYIEARTVAPLADSNPNTCLLTPTLNELGPFLEDAWAAWRELLVSDEAWIRTLKSVTSFYQETLSAKFATVKLALTAMSLERLREQVLGDSELLVDFSGNKRDKVEKEIRCRIREVIGTMDRLSDSEEVRRKLLDSLAANPGKVKDLFRKPFQEALSDLIHAGGHYVEESRLKQYVRRRNQVVHGTASGDVEETLATYYLAEYGLAQVEKLVLRRLEYKGLYYERTVAEIKEFPEGRAYW